jgi:alkylhydroperoxidase family enzyme
MFDRLSTKTMRYVSAVPRKKATGLTKRVYDMIDEDFFMNGSLTSRSTVPELLAAIWTSGRETMLVDDHLDRTTKEAICGVLSDINDCPYCGDMLVSLVDAGKEHDAAAAIYKGGVEKIRDPRLRDQLAWVEAVGDYGSTKIPPCPFTAEELPEVLGSLMAMADINRFSHVVMDGSPVDLPFGLQRPALRLFGRELVATKVRSSEPGRALDLLPSAPVPADLAWARSNPRIADALARYAAVVEQETAGVIPPAVRERVAARLAEWKNEEMPLSRSWVEKEVAGLEGEERAMARLALLLAKAPHQVSEDVVEELTGDGPRFVRILAWASFTAARRFAAIVADKVNLESGAAQPPRTEPRCASRSRRAGMATTLLISLATLSGCGDDDWCLLCPHDGPMTVESREVTPSSAMILWSRHREARSYSIVRDGKVVSTLPQGVFHHNDEELAPNREYRYRVIARAGPFDDPGDRSLGKTPTMKVRTTSPEPWSRADFLGTGAASGLIAVPDGSLEMLHATGAGELFHVREADRALIRTPIAAGSRGKLVVTLVGARWAVYERSGQLWAAAEGEGRWRSELIDAGPLEEAADLDACASPDGDLHVAYVARGRGLRHATNESGIWEVESLGSDPAVRRLSVAAGSAAHVLANEEGTIVHRTNETGEWRDRRVTPDHETGEEAVASVMGPDGTIHVATNFDRGVEYYRWSEGAWRRQWRTHNLGLRGDASITLDRNGAIHIAYHGAANDLLYATDAGGEWSRHYIDVEGDVGGANAIAVDASGLVNIVYRDADRNAVRRARGAILP